MTHSNIHTKQNIYLQLTNSLAFSICNKLLGLDCCNILWIVNSHIMLALYDIWKKKNACQIGIDSSKPSLIISPCVCVRFIFKACFGVWFALVRKPSNGICGSTFSLTQLANPLISVWFFTNNFVQD